MKITKRRLRQIIKEEKHRQLSETIVDTGLFDAAVKNAVKEISDQFGASMMRLWDEDPAMMGERYTDKSEWQQQVTYAQQELDTGLEYTIEEKIQEVETKLHDGQFSGDSPLSAWDAHVSEFGEPAEDEISGGGGLSENEARALKDMPPAWRQILGVCLKDKI